MEFIPEHSPRQLQRQVLAPELRQSLAILQMSLVELQIHVARELLENCLLEQEEDRDEDRSPEEPADVDVHPAEEPDQEWTEYFADGRDLGTTAAARPGPESLASALPSLQDHLLAQFHLFSLSEKVLRIGEFLIGNFDDDGYLRCGVPESAASLGASSQEVDEVLRLLQTLEPPGVGARDLRECLLVQLMLREDWDERSRTLAGAIIEDCLGDLAAGRQAGIARKLGQPMPAIEAALELIGQLDPRPGRNYGPTGPGFLIPDVTVRYVGTDCFVAVNEGSTAGLRINPFYQKVLTGVQAADRETMDYLRAKLGAATALLKSVEQRKLTLARVTEAVVRLQRPFFTGREAPLRPLTLREVAQEVGLHESTVSRAMAGKYLETPRGILGYRHFFGTALARRGGEAISSGDVKRLIRQTLARERMSDQQLTARLQDLGIKIARRTVAKYREELGILPASRRER